MLISKLKADVWDSANAITCFYEYHYFCGNCDGIGFLNNNEDDICSECEGLGEWYEWR